MVRENLIVGVLVRSLRLQRKESAHPDTLTQISAQNRLVTSHSYRRARVSIEIGYGRCDSPLGLVDRNENGYY